MIKKIVLTRFKKYKSQTFELHPNGLTLLVGGNNAGKSTLIQALAVWEFCKMVLLHEKGRDWFNADEFEKGEGLGMSTEDFLPIAVPTLNHLWTNLKTQLTGAEKKTAKTGKYPGYILRIKCIWDTNAVQNKSLEIGLSLINDRLFVRITDSNLVDGDAIPNVVYLPTFAGVLPKENKITLAERRAFLGKGMAGSIIRNMIYDLYVEDEKIKAEIQGDRRSLTPEKKLAYKQKSPLQKLQENLRSTFSSELEIEKFSEEFHTTIKIYERKVKRTSLGYEAIPKSKYTSRDIITQGSGFLQWLSIFGVLYSPHVDVLLLDEPDAHLHASLQNEMLKYLSSASSSDNVKQIIVSTHSVEMIKKSPLDNVFSIDKRKYLDNEFSRVCALEGIGCDYSPRLDKLKECKKLLFVENETDYNVLKKIAFVGGLGFPQDIVVWSNTYSHNIRCHIFEELKKAVKDLKCISFRDCDMEERKKVQKDLTFIDTKAKIDEGILCMTWKRKNIESYLLCPKAISKAANKHIPSGANSVSEKDVTDYLSSEHAVSITKKYWEAEAPETILLLDGKHILYENTESVCRKFNCKEDEILEELQSDEICEDLKTFISRTNSFLT